MKTRQTTLLTFLFFLALVAISNSVRSQILISLLLGDKLNSPNLEFGLEGGFNSSWLSGIDESKGLSHLHLGFYFDFRMKNDLWLNTGVRVKSNGGAKDLNPYSLEDPELDAVFLDGQVERKLRYFYVPVHLKYRFANKKQFYVMAGGQVGLRAKATDTFYNSYIDKNDVSFTKDIGDYIKRFDVGLSGGFGYKFKGSGMNLGLTYYHGLMNIMETTDLPQYNYTSKNSSLYLYVDIPIGAGYKDKDE